MKRKVHDVIKKGDKWIVKDRDNKRASAAKETKKEAVQRGAEIAKSKGKSQLVIRKKDGKIQSERTYRDDPHPPKG